MKLYHVFILTTTILCHLQLPAYCSLSKDSLFNIIEGDYHDTLKIDALYNLAIILIDQDFKVGYNYAKNAILLAEENQLPRRKAHIYEALARHFSKSGNSEITKFYYKLSIQSYIDCGDNYKVARLYHDLSRIYMYENNSDSCKLYILKEIEVLRKENDSIEIAKCFIDLGGRLSQTGDYINSINYIFKGLNEESIKNDSLLKAVGYSNLSNIYSILNKPQKSLEYIKMSCKLSINTTKYPLFLMNLGAHFSYLKDSFPSYQDSVIYCFEESLKYDSLLSANYRLELCHNLSAAYLEANNKNKAQQYLEKCKHLLNETNTIFHRNLIKLLQATYFLKTKEYNKTLLILKNFDAHGNYEHQKQYYHNMHEALFSTKNYKEAYFHIREFMLLKDSIKCAENYDAVYSKEAEFNYRLKEQKLKDKQEKERIALQSRMKIRRIIIVSLLLIVSLLGIICWFIYINYKNKKNDNILLSEQKKEIEDKEKITASLLKELNHRVKNNLQMVSGLLTMQAYKLKESEAKDTLNNARLRIESLSLLHQHLYKTTDNINPDISTYIKHLANYIIDSSNVENVKLQLNIDNVRIKTEVAIHIGLIINELIMNALKYGTDPIKKDNWINVNLHKRNDQIIIKVSDSGNKTHNNYSKLNSSSFGHKLISILLTEYNGKFKSDLTNNGKVEIILNNHINHQIITC